MGTFVFLLVFPFIGFANKTEINSFDHEHNIWSNVLKKFVVINDAKSQVKYKELKKNPQQLKSYLSQLSNVSKTQFKSWNERQQIAFLINAYNAFTLKLVTDNYPVKSIKDIGGFFSSPWKKEFFELLGKKTYLDYLEHKMLRKNYKEPRFHFAVNCASVGCPALRGEAFTPEKLDTQLQDQGQLFMQDKTRNQLDLIKKTLRISPIFKWFKKDFGGRKSDVIRFALPYLTNQQLDEKVIQELDLEYSDYDWSLNDM